MHKRNVCPDSYSYYILAIFSRLKLFFPPPKPAAKMNSGPMNCYPVSCINLILAKLWVPELLGFFKKEQGLKYIKTLIFLSIKRIKQRVSQHSQTKRVWLKGSQTLKRKRNSRNHSVYLSIYLLLQIRKLKVLHIKLIPL